MTNTEFEEYYKRGDNVRINQGLMPIAKNLARKYYKYNWGLDAYHEAMLCAIEAIEDLNIGHNNYMGYLVSKMRGHISNKFRQHIFLSKCSKRYKKEGAYIIIDIDVLITDPEHQNTYSYENKEKEVFETLSHLCVDWTDRQIITLRSRGFNETETAKQLGISQQAVSQRLLRLLDKYQKLMRS